MDKRSAAPMLLSTKCTWCEFVAENSYNVRCHTVIDSVKKDNGLLEMFSDIWPVIPRSGNSR